jgi:hypothetical protein
MVHFRPRIGFPANGDYTYNLHGRRYRVGSSGSRTLKLLTEIYDSCAACADQSWPFSVRKQIKQVQDLNASALLCLVVERTDDPTVRILAIWLRGRCGGSLGTASLAKFAHHPDDQIRKEVARALKRMGAWAQLREMAENDTSERIRRMATSEPSRPYRDRLSDFSRRFPRVNVASVKQPLFVSPQLELGQGRPPKSRSVIRMILERIHRIVAGQSR